LRRSFLSESQFFRLIFQFFCDKNIIYRLLSTYAFATLWINTGTYGSFTGETEMENLDALKAGAAGAISLNIIHETARKLLPNAPHVDQIGMRAVTLAGDLLSNSLYYALVVGSGKKQDVRSVWRKAAFFGLAAGVGTRAKSGRQNYKASPRRILGRP
jgi:hypothetical protein